jgi:hypothetical protein
MYNNFTNKHESDYTGIKEFVQKFEVSNLYDDERWTADDINDVEYYILNSICRRCENRFIVDFDFENINMTDIDMGGLYGFQTLPNGMEILGLFIGGDWEIPVNVILYLKNGKLYNYIPKFGNCYNHETNKAYLNENVDDPHFCFINFNYDKDKMIEEILSKF